MNLEEVIKLEKRVDDPNFMQTWLTVSKIREIVKELRQEKKANKKLRERLKEAKNG
jgi:predicted RNase H-like nuclease